MNEHNQDNFTDTSTEVNGTGMNESQNYSYKSDQIIQDSDCNQSNKANEQPTHQQYTYQSRQPQYNQPNKQNYTGYGYGGYSNSGYNYNQPTARYSPQPATQAKKQQPRPVSIGTVIVCMIITAIITAIISVSVAATLKINPDKFNNGTTTNETTIIQSTVEMSQVEAVATAVTPSVVCIEVTTKTQNNSYSPFFGNYGNGQVYESTSYGSGVIYSTDGYIITNYHVISGVYSSNTVGSKVEVYLDNDSENGIAATIIGYNSAADLAVLKIEKTGLPAVKIGDSSKLTIGQTVIAIGSPGGIEFAGSVTSGIISGLDRKLSVDSVTMSLIQTDAAINPGNSGGALVDVEGQLIGVPNVKISASGYEGMGFCIPVNTVVDICTNIIENGMDGDPSDSAPYLGVEINTNFTGGAYISAVAEGGPAEKAGLKSGDIIISFDGNKVTGYDDLVNAINSHKSGDTVTVGIYRNGKEGSLSVTLGSNG
ncbi:MAG: trypsin-like peptidase domain-containing protein [Clostridia bacterium]|nr:trypsin-like peptidase domain-containing protein [Clostridia bacterium]